MARKNAAVRRDEILAATVEEIESAGLRTLRVSDVAGRLGLSASLVIYHFETKEALVAAAFDFAGRQDIDRARELAGTTAPPVGGDGNATMGATSASEGSSVLQRLRAVIGWYMPSGSSRSWKIWIDGWSAGLFDDELQTTFATLHREWKTILAGLMDEGITAGECAAPDGGSEASATRTLAYLDGLAIQLMVNSEAVDPAQARTWAEDFLARELKASGLR